MTDQAVVRRREPPESRDLRALTTGERRRVLERLRQHWPVPDGDWWHPYTAFASEIEPLRLQSGWLFHELPPIEFRRRAALRWSKFWVMSEGAPRWDDL